MSLVPLPVDACPGHSQPANSDKPDLDHNNFDLMSPSPSLSTSPSPNMSNSAKMPATTRRTKLQTPSSSAASRPAFANDNQPANHKTISPAEATRILNEQAFEISTPTLGKSNVSKVHFASLPAHEENEDASAYDFLLDARSLAGVDGDSEEQQWYWGFFAVYDGHYGHSTSRYLKQVLIQQVYRSLLHLYKTSDLSTPPPDDLIKSTIANTFTALDASLIKASQQSTSNIINNSNKINNDENSSNNVATQGSCALLTFHDARHNRLFTACTGDSRAVHGKRLGSTQNTRWLSKPLSVDQNFSSNPEETKRVEAEHPGEQGVVVQNRLMGDLAVSRAFGNKRFKVRSASSSDGGNGKGRSGSVSSGNNSSIITPPYVTAEPVVSTYHGIKEGDFVILGSDGLWDFLSSEDAVALVGRWTDEHLDLSRKQLTRLTQSQQEMFVFENDGNAGVHLIRNALGGVREGRLLFTLGLPPGKEAAKRHRDDITVVVVFFGREDVAKVYT
ncbi:hypothetical protein ABW20_dc0110018 [Dactylellina cionopaga]|nr:hypothetical protein ABW20_dc0110018 [Dactylellina cionopaga]